MKKLLCYLGILVLLFLLLLPPALRIFLKDKDETITDTETKTNETLVCKNDNFTVSTNYSGDEILMIVLKRVIQERDDLIDESNLESEDLIDESNLESEDLIDETNKELDELFDSIKDDETITYNEIDDSEVIGIDFDIYQHENLKLDLITKPIKEQQQYYESLNFKCLVK